MIFKKRFLLRREFLLNKLMRFERSTCLANAESHSVGPCYMFRSGKFLPYSDLGYVICTWPVHSRVPSFYFIFMIDMSLS